MQTNTAPNRNARFSLTLNLRRMAVAPPERITRFFIPDSVVGLSAGRPPGPSLSLPLSHTHARAPSRRLRPKLEAGRRAPVGTRLTSLCHSQSDVTPAGDETHTLGAARGRPAGSTRAVQNTAATLMELHWSKWRQSAEN